MEEENEGSELAKAMKSLAVSLANLTQGELESGSSHLELIEKLNLKTAEEYDDYGDFASGLLVYVERLKQKNESLCSYLEVINDVDREVNELEAVVSTLDSYTADLETQLRGGLGEYSSQAKLT